MPMATPPPSTTTMVNTSVGEQPRAFLDARVAPHDAGRSRAARLAVLVHQITKGDDADRAVVIIEDGNSGDAELDNLAAREDEPVAVANVEQLRVHDVRDARHVSTESNAWTSEGERPNPFLGRALEPCPAPIRDAASQSLNPELMATGRAGPPRARRS